MEKVSRLRASEIADDFARVLQPIFRSSIFITGSTGLIGQALVRCILSLNERCNAGIRIYAPVRNMDKGVALFGSSPSISYCEYGEDWTSFVSEVGYVVHMAANTSSLEFAEKPAEIMVDALVNARRIVEGCRRWSPKKVLFTSSMEVYGSGAEKSLTEVETGSFDTEISRNSYPVTKIFLESLFHAFRYQYGIPTICARLSQSFGPGVSQLDERVFSEFARCAISGSDIVLLTSGEKKNSYLHTYDAASALLVLLALGEEGNTYNVANAKTYCSIRHMAEFVLDDFSVNSEAKVRIQPDGSSARRFRPDGSLRLDCSKLEDLGWHARYGMRDMYADLIADWRS